MHNPQPETFILGLSHGLLWIGMSLACLYAARARVIPLRIAVAVAVLGGIGPFFGSAEFMREQRRRARARQLPGSGGSPARVHVMAVDTTMQVVMPKMGDSVAEGTVLEWRKAEGDRVAADETIVEISTDKVDAEVAAPAAGTLVKIHAAEGETVSVGAVLAEIVPANGSDPVADGRAARQPWKLNATPPTIVDIVTPKAGESVSEGTILDWTVAVGERVEAGRHGRRDLRPTKSTSSCPHLPAGRSPSSSRARATPSPSAR